MTEQQIVRALQIMCGTYATARMLERRGYPIYMARHLLCKRGK